MDDQEWSYLCGRRHQLVFKVQMNRLYQLRRQATMEWREGLVKVLSLAAGSVAFAKVSDPTVVQWAAAFIFCGTAASMVFGWGAKARDASRRASQWISLLRDIQGAGERTFTEAQLDAWTAQANELESTEPPANERLLKQVFAATEQLYRDRPENLSNPIVPGVIVP